MARRQRNQSSTFDDIFDIAAMLPWQAGVVLAVIVFTVLHLYSISTPPPVDLKVVSSGMDNVLHTIGRGVAGMAKYGVSVLILAGALVSYLGKKRRQALHNRVAADPAATALEKMSWVDFEELVAETFRQKGYRVVERGGAGPDGGVDIEVYLGADKYLVQCKQWKTRQVGVAAVRELYGVMAAVGAVGGFLVASGDFTPDAADFAAGRSIELVDAKKLRRMIGGRQATKPTQTTPTVTSPACPICGSHMVGRTVKKGPSAGNRFWGCPQYPKCRGVRN